jgi:hypothetical protein
VRTLPSKFPTTFGIFEVGLVFSGPITEKISFSGTPVSRGKINGNVPAAKLPKKAKDRTFNHYQ